MPDYRMNVLIGLLISPFAKSDNPQCLWSSA